MRTAALRRYPVKSMLGEDVAELALAPGGVEGDRAFAVIDTGTGLVATAKHPRLWRRLLAFAAGTGSCVLVRFPDGTEVPADAPDLAVRLSAELGRAVTVSGIRPDGASVERPAPEDVLGQGVSAVVPAQVLEIGQGSTGRNFVDHSPVHLITTATLRHLGTELVRYRPNVVVETPGDTEAFVENSWLGKEVRVGEALLRVTIPTPRCSVPSLAHGALAPDPEAVRAVMRDNRIDVPGLGKAMPCAGAYAQVVKAGRVALGDPVTVRG